MSSREFRCYDCGKVQTWEITAEPKCCGREMKPGPTHVPRSNNFRVDLVKLRPENPKWKQNDRWEDQWEVWLLWAGRDGKQDEQDNLFIGIVGKTLLGWEYEMAPGYSPQLGAGFERNRLVAEMTLIATGGDL